MQPDTVIIIPSRLGSERLSQKPLQRIGNLTMIEHVLASIEKLGYPVYVATDADLIAEVVREAGGEVIMTDPACASGTDRVYQALQRIPDSQNIKYVINLQGDMPFVESGTLLEVINELRRGEYKIVTPVVKAPFEVAQSDSNVKVVVSNNNKALYFSRRMVPYGENADYLCHVGIYGFTREVLAEFVNLPPSELEKKERLEQLRALENGIEIGICYVQDYPISVDTQEDLDKAIVAFNKKSFNFV